MWCELIRFSGAAGQLVHASLTEHSIGWAAVAVFPRQVSEPGAAREPRGDVPRRAWRRANLRRVHAAWRRRGG